MELFQLKELFKEKQDRMFVREGTYYSLTKVREDGFLEFTEMGNGRFDTVWHKVHCFDSDTLKLFVELVPMWQQHSAKRTT